MCGVRWKIRASTSSAALPPSSPRLSGPNFLIGPRSSRKQGSREASKAMHLIRTAFVALALLAAGHARAQNYPDRTIRILVGFTPGSATDISARMFAQKLGE